MRNSTKRILVILGGFAMLIGSFYIYLSMIVPTYGVIQILKAEVASKNDTSERQKAAEAAIIKFETDSAGDPGTKKFLSTALPNKIDIPSILNQFQAMAKRNQLLLQSLSFQYLPIQQSRDPLILPVGVVRATVGFSGTYASLKTFVSDLERNIRIIDVSSIKVDGGAKPASEILVFNLTADIYYQEQ